MQSPGTTGRVVDVVVVNAIDVVVMTTSATVVVAAVSLVDWLAQPAKEIAARATASDDGRTTLAGIEKYRNRRRNAT